MKTASALWILLGFAWLGIYWPLLADNVPAFRDAFHFYYPLEHWLDRQARLGDYIPQFNPMDGTGSNLVGEMSTGLFYPGRLLWWLPMLSVAQRLGLVLLAHTVIAGLSAAYAARRMQLDAIPQLLAATAYSLSGPVFFQHVNPIFLISAAWLPLAIAECWAMATPTPTPTPIRWPVWILACSMMLLGGDPQSTMHCGVLALLALGYSAWHTRSLTHSTRLISRLGLSVVAVTGLTAVQSLPTWYWYRSSQQSVGLDVTSADRGAEDVPALLQSIPTTTTYDLARGSPYSYSIAPWHAVTLVWSNVFGHFMPEHTRWISAWPSESRMWTCSLSVGLVTILLALSAFHRSAKRSAIGYYGIVLLLAGTAMLGNHAPTWMLRNGLHWLAMDASWLPGDEVGGTYWLLQQYLPGYAAFRFPGKWSTIFALALTMCAAHSLEHCAELRKCFSRWLRAITILSWTLCALVFVAAYWSNTREMFASWLAHAQPDPWLGVVEPSAALNGLQLGLLIPSIVLLFASVIERQARSLLQPRWLLLLVMIEMSWSAHQWLATVPASQVSVSMPATGQAVITRTWAGIGQANIGLDQPPPLTLDSKLRYQQQFALAKLHLLSPSCGSLNAFMTLTPQALVRVRHRLAQHDRLTPVDAPLDEALAWLGVQWRMVRGQALQWQAIPGAAALVEFSPQTTAGNTLHVKYLQGSRMEVETDCESPTRLIVRLFQDGGWRARLRDSVGHEQVIEPNRSHLGLFQSLDVPAGKCHIELQYRAPGIVLGAWISALTLLVMAAFVIRSVIGQRRLAGQAVYGLLHSRSQRYEAVDREPCCFHRVATVVT